MPIRQILAAGLLAAAAAIPASAREVPMPGPTASIEQSRRYFTTDPDAPWIGAAKPDVTVVVYTDYNCPYCRRSAQAVVDLAKRDRKVQVVFRDWPVIAKESVVAAKYAIAAKYQGKYLPFHLALMKAQRPLTTEKIRATAGTVGIDWARLNADLKTHGDDIVDLITRNHQQAEMLNFTGTPGYIVGNFQQWGEMSLADLQKTVAEARAHARGKPSTIRKSRRPR